MAKAKGRDGLGDVVSKTDLGIEEKLRLLEDKLLKGEISERTYEELKRKYETSSSNSSPSSGKTPEGTSIKCPNCEHRWQITSKTRPLEVTCPKCGAKGILE